MAEPLAQLESLEVRDEVLTDVARRCREILEGLASVRCIQGLRVFFVDFSRADESLRASVYATDSCKALFEPPVIVVNAGFLLSLEAAFRSFDLSEPLLGSQYLRGDAEVFGLVRRIRGDAEVGLAGHPHDRPADYLHRLRRLERLQIRRDRAYTIESLAMVTLFFICHEVGHLMDGVGERHYATFLQPDASLEDRVANAALKLCHHVDEFARYGFDLPGFKAVEARESEVRVRERELSAGLETLRLNHAAFFRDEVSADEKGTGLLLSHLDSIAQKDSFQADKLRYVTIKGLFVAALYSWSRDFLTFGEKLGMNGPPEAHVLMGWAMMKPELYIHAASLFGAVHRFTLLRAALAAEAIIRSGSDFFDRDDPEKTIWWKRERALPRGPLREERKWWQVLRFRWEGAGRDEERAVLREWWLTESLQRYYLLCVLMDTAVKLAYIGCLTPWKREADRKRGSPQLFSMRFDTIDQAVRLMRRRLR